MSDAKQVVLTLTADGVGIEIGDALSDMAVLVMLAQAIQGVTGHMAKVQIDMTSPIVSASGTIPVVQ